MTTQSRNKREGRYAGKRKGYAYGPVARHFRAGEPLPDGLVRDEVLGSLWAQCVSCENLYEYPGEAHQFTQDMSYCNGSDRCTP